jgi:hypothetical protein
MSNMKRIATSTAFVLLALAGLAQAQTFNTTGTTSVSVAVAAEAAISIGTATTTIANTPGTFSSPYTGTTALTYKIRTTKVGGTGTITLKVTSDFAPSGGPSVATPPTTGDALSYTCTLSAPGTACSGSLTSSTTAATSVGTFGAGAKSTSAGNSGSVAWSLTNDPVYDTGNFSATVTFTIAAT